MTNPPPPPYGEYPPTPPEPGPGYYGHGGAPGPMPGPPGYPPPYPPPNTNGLAVASLVCAFLFFPLGIVFGHMSLSQIRKNHEGGHGLAVAGLVISYVVAVLTVIAVVGTFVFAAFIVSFADDFHGPVSADHHRRPSASSRSTAALHAVADARGELPVPGHDGEGQQTRQPPTHRPGADHARDRRRHDRHR